MEANTDTESLLINSLSDEQAEGLMADDIPAEYDIDYSKAKPDRFASMPQDARREPD